MKKNALAYIGKITVFLILMFLLTGCKTKVSPEDIENLKQRIPDMVFLGDEINLPTRINKTQITFSVNKEGYFDETGKVIKAETHDVTLIITVFGNKTPLFEKKAILSQKIEVLFQEVEKYVRSFIRHRTGSDIYLVSEYYDYDDISFVYQSNRPDIIDHDGTHYAHDYDEPVTIEVTVNARGKTHRFSVEVEAVGLPDGEKLNRVSDWLDEYMETIEFTDDFELPKTHPDYGGTIKWVASDPFVVIGQNRFFFPREEERVVLMTQITFPGGDKQKEYIFDLPASSMDDFSRAKRFLEISFEEQMDDFFVLYDGSSPDITRFLLEGDAKNKLYGAKREELDLANLDKWFYPGYEKPNDDNPLFIVVHETGIRTPGINAKYYSEFQYNKAYVADEVDAWTSWHYTVDDHSIYQSYLDQSECWNAGDGDIYGIGIEMCINADGNYNASLINNARLIASLLIKHNLGMKSLKMHHDYSAKPCPETMLQNRLWFNFLKMIAYEYVSQALLSQFEITYTYDLIEGLSSWPIEQVIYNEGVTVDSVQNIKVEVDGSELNFQIRVSAK